MQFTSQFLDELRSRVTTSSVVGRGVRLVRKGREFQGLCPFHNEKTPSFTVNDTKGFYHCFGCGAHGDAISFLMENVGMGYAEAITQLAQEVGLPLPKPDRYAAEKERKTATLYEVIETACRFYQSALMSPEGRSAREYLKSRGIGEEIAKTFRLGFAPDRFTSLKDALAAKSITEAQMQVTGLLTEKAGKAPYDKFRNRVIFPILDSRNRVIAFGGRILGDGIPKYLNSPETQLFHKGEGLYNLSLAKESAYQKQEIIVAEGYMDVIAFHKAGITNAVAPLGTAITESQLMLLWKTAKEPVLCLDGDNAGKRAMVRAAMLALPLLKPGYSLSFALLPGGMDPDDIIKVEGSNAIRKYLSGALPLSEVLWRLESAKKRVTPEQKAALEEKLKSYAAEIKDKTVQAYYHKFFNEKLWQWSRAGLGKAMAQQKAGLGKPLDSQRNVNQIELCEQTILALMIHHPQLLEQHEVEEDLNYLHFSSEYLDKLCSTILEIKNFAADTALTQAFMVKALEEKGLSKEVALLSKGRNGLGEEFLSPNAEESMVQLGWKYVIGQRNLALMEAERLRMLADVTEESHTKATEIEKQMVELKKLLQMHEYI